MERHLLPYFPAKDHLKNKPEVEKNIKRVVDERFT